MPPLEEETARFLAAWMQVRQVVQAANFNRFQRAGLSATQFMTLNIVPADGMTLAELARKLNLSQATLHETVNSLEERGMVQRIRSTVDRRKRIICATPEGQHMQNSASLDFHQFMAGLFRQMSEAEREGLLAGLEQMVKLSSSSRGEAQANRHADAAPPGERNSRRSRPR